MLAPDRTFARRDTALFVLCIALSIGALFAPESWQYAAASSARASARSDSASRNARRRSENASYSTSARASASALLTDPA